MSSSWLEIPQLGGYLNLIWIISYYNTDYLCLKSHWKKQYYTEDENKNKEKECVEKRPPPLVPSPFWSGEGDIKFPKNWVKVGGADFLKNHWRTQRVRGEIQKL